MERGSNIKTNLNEDGLHNIHEHEDINVAHEFVFDEEQAKKPIESEINL